MILIKRTTSSNPDFQSLVNMLDNYLNKKDEKAYIESSICFEKNLETI